MQTQGNFGRRAPAKAEAAVASPPAVYSEAWRELSEGLDHKAKAPGLFSAVFGGARGAVIALGGCTAMLGIFFMVYLRGFARFGDENLNHLMIGGAVLVLILPRLLPLLNRKR